MWALNVLAQLGKPIPCQRDAYIDPQESKGLLMNLSLAIW